MRLQLLGIAGLAVAGILAYDHYDKSANFLPVEARVSAVNDQCFMEKVERGAVTKTTSTSGLLGCDMARFLTREHPKWQGYSVVHKIEIRFAFVSPADGATHTSSLQMSAFPDGRPLQAGDVLQVLASKTQPDKTRRA